MPRPSKANRNTVKVLVVLPLTGIVYMLFTILHYRSIEDRIQHAFTRMKNLKAENAKFQEFIFSFRASDVKTSNSSTDLEASILKEKIANTLHKINKLKSNQQEHITDQLKAFDHRHEDAFVVPTTDHETTRRDVGFVADDMWMYLQSELNKLKTKSMEFNENFTRAIDIILDNSYGYNTKLKTDLYRLGNTIDNVENWRTMESRMLGQLVQKRLSFLQNPEDCSKAKKLVCKMDKVCGFGCQLNHVTYCLIMAYGTQRTLVLESKKWHYAPGEGWESVFLPLSNTCVTSDKRANVWKGLPDSRAVVKLPFINYLSPCPDFLPFALPEDLADRLERFHGEPGAWWIGQFVKYLMRPNKKLQTYTEERIRTLGFSRPIVGVQIRRTDKITRGEAAFHSLDEYMKHVKAWYDVYERSHPIVQRKIFLATDDPTILPEAILKYPGYKFISDNDVSKTAKVDMRYTNTSLRGIFLDIHLLSMCNYLVCTFSSQVCRSAYEKMQPRFGDASGWFRSLDDSYHFYGQNPHYWKAVVPHKARNRDEISFEIGDMINIAGNHWNGFSKGTNVKIKTEGFFPSYKVKSVIERVAMPTYPEVKLNIKQVLLE